MGKKYAGRGNGRVDELLPQARNAKARKSKKPVKEAPEPEQEPEIALVDDQDVPGQQLLLNVFRNAFNELLSSASFSTSLQEVKQALFNREFEKAFGNEENLEVYAARWSPTRALCYEAILQVIKPHLEPICLPKSAGEDGTDGLPPRSLRVVAIGGGSAETAALGGFLRRARDDGMHGNATLLDSGPWASVVEKLREGLTTTPPISRYANAAAKEANGPAVAPARLSATFAQHDVLALGKAGLARHIGSQPVLATLLFTLNELFTSGGIGKTTAFLLDLTSALPVGSLLLIVDSPGSYSETMIGKQAKRYPMQWLLNKILLGTEDGPVQGRRWTKLESQDSVWFRLSKALNYSIPLEDMRYQMHLYQVNSTKSAEDTSVKSAV